jgi:predicted nucleic acid-binding protein
MKRTYIDSGVLIAAARGTTDVSISAMQILDDPHREFASSIFVKLEVLPKAICYKNTAESDFYEEFFSAVSYWANSLESIVENAYHEACHLGLAAIDAIHVAAAKSVGAEELVTSEKLGKPIHRAIGIKVISIVPPTDVR